MNRWSPDTCKCVFDFEPHPDGISQTLVEVINKCSNHSGLSGTALHNTVHKLENVVKNKVHSKILDDPDFADAIVNEEGNTIKNLKKGVKFEWSFSGNDGNRILTIDGVKLNINSNKKSTLVSIFDAEHGTGKVQIS